LNQEAWHIAGRHSRPLTGFIHLPISSKERR
jgi:hypothetical protein